MKDINKNIFLEITANQSKVQIKVNMPIWVSVESNGVHHVKAPLLGIYFFVSSKEEIESTMQSAMKCFFQAYATPKDVNKSISDFTEALKDFGWEIDRQSHGKMLKQHLPKNYPPLMGIFQTGQQNSYFIAV